MHWQSQITKINLQAQWGISNVGQHSILNIVGLDRLPKIFKFASQPDSKRSIDFKSRLQILHRKTKGRVVTNYRNPGKFLLPFSVKRTMAEFSDVFKQSYMPHVIRGKFEQIYNLNL